MKLLVYTLYFLIGFVRAFSACFIIKHVFRWKLKKYLLFSFVFGGITLCFEIITHLFSMPGLSLNDHYLCAVFIPLIWLMLTDLSVLLKKINYPGRSLLDYFFCIHCTLLLFYYCRACVRSDTSPKSRYQQVFVRLIWFYKKYPAGYILDTSSPYYVFKVRRRTLTKYRKRGVQYYEKTVYFSYRFYSCSSLYDDRLRKYGRQR